MPQDELPRWQGRVDAHMDAVPKQIETLFKSLDVEEKARQLVHDDLNKKLDTVFSECKKELQDLATKLSNLTSRLAVIAAIGSFIGTVVTSLFVSAIIKIFLK